MAFLHVVFWALHSGIIRHPLSTASGEGDNASLDEVFRNTTMFGVLPSFEMPAADQRWPDSRRRATRGGLPWRTEDADALQRSGKIVMRRSGLLAVAQSLCPILRYVAAAFAQLAFWWSLRQNSRFRKRVLRFAAWLAATAFIALAVSVFTVCPLVTDALSYERGEAKTTWRYSDEAVAEITGLQDYVAALAAHDVVAGNGLYLSAASVNEEKGLTHLLTTQQHAFDTVSCAPASSPLRLL